MPLVGPEKPLTAMPASPESVPARVRRYQKLVALLFAILCFEIGIFLVAFPWSPYWNANYFSWLSLEWRSFWLSPYLRGAVSGLGMVNLYVSLLEVLRLHAGAMPDGQDPRMGQPPSVRMKGQGSL